MHEAQRKQVGLAHRAPERGAAAPRIEAAAGATARESRPAVVACAPGGVLTVLIKVLRHSSSWRSSS